ncbi:MAG: trehalose-phosphatase [Candidatus Omnitrophica bacterium CG11_big_fil_rev_8_21_14_0_20_41_12]|nr:MAG: trehalose-phosphatase [Candidatus Omnitrophica bacterium CG11_big_fil_rev_8_21_14_0_20_41_12]
MRYIFDDLEKIQQDLKGKYLFLFLDCDGTLAAIADTPDQAIISQRTKKLLSLLSQKKNCRIAVVSGRSLDDIKKKVGLKNIIYSGNHGFQIDGPKIKHELVVPGGYKEVLRRIRVELKKKLSDVRGVLVEDKKLSLALHFRLAALKQLPLIRSVFSRSTAPYLKNNKIRIKPGKKVLEVGPPLAWNKGKIVLWLLARQAALSKKQRIIPVYIGDDVTDEDAFKALKNNGLTIFVGAGNNSQAKYYLKDVQDVYNFLKYILNLEG